MCCFRMLLRDLGGWAWRVNRRRALAVFARAFHMARLKQAVRGLSKLTCPSLVFLNACRHNCVDMFNFAHQRGEHGQLG